MTRISTAMERIEAARHRAEAATGSLMHEKPGSARILSLVNAHEKLREEVADTIGQIDTLIGELEGE